MKNTKLFVLAAAVMLFGFSACKSTKVATEGMPASDEMADVMPDNMPEATPVVQSQSNTPSSSMDVAGLVAKHLMARGGVENIKAVQSLKMTGSLEVMGMDVEMTNYIKRPNKIRSQLLIKSMNMEVNQGYDGSMGWMQQPGSDPQPMPKEMANAVKDQASIDGILMDYEDKGYTLEYVEETTVNESPAHKIKLMRPGHPDSIIYLDTTSHLEVKVDGEGTNPQSGEKMQTETYMSDYRSVDGIQMAHLIEVKVDGTTFQKIVFSTIEANVDIDDQLFQMPGMTVDIK